MVRIQGIVAVLIPWVVAVVVSPGSRVWSLLALVVPLVFAALHTRYWIAWLAPISGLVSITPGIATWVSASVAVAIAIVLVVWPPEASSDRLPRWLASPAVRWSMGAALLVGAVAIASFGLIQVRDQDAAFDAGQEAAAESWQVEADVDAPSGESPTESPEPLDPLAELSTTEGPRLVGDPATVQEDAAEPAAPPFAKLAFKRAGSPDPVTPRVLYVGPDVTERGLASGPGHYPGTAKPGRKGNVAIAGHRTGWGSPFLHLDELEPGDRIRLTDRKGVRHTYIVDTSTLVDPDGDWVLGPDPLGTGEPTLTLTTCDPPGVNSKRLIVFATLKKSVPRTTDTA